MPFLCHPDSETVQDWIANEANDEPTCIWWEGDDGGPWATQCNELFNIESEGPEANGMRFCCFCGRKLVEVASDSDEVEVWKAHNCVMRI